MVLLGVPTVTATVIAHERGPKILIGKYRKRTGYKRHNGFRAATSRVEISLGTGAAAKPAAKKTVERAEGAVSAVAKAVAAVQTSRRRMRPKSPLRAGGSCRTEADGSRGDEADVEAGRRASRSRCRSPSAQAEAPAPQPARGLSRNGASRSPR